MRTHVEIQRDGRTYEWTGDLPLIPEGHHISLPGILMTQVQVSTVILDKGGASIQRLVLGP